MQQRSSSAVRVGSPRPRRVIVGVILGLAVLLGPPSFSEYATSKAATNTPTGQSKFENATAHREWARRIRDARRALQGLQFRKAQFQFVAALDLLDPDSPGDVRYRATLGHLVRLAAIYGRLEREEDAEHVMSIVTRYASTPTGAQSRSAAKEELRDRLATEALRYDALYRDWLARPLEPSFSPRVPDTPRAPTDLETLISQTANTYRVDPLLVKAVVAAESNFETHAVSSAGAQGLMQLMPGTAKEMGVRAPFKAKDNLRGGVRYLRKLLDRYNDLEPALAAYNAGPGAVDRYGGIPPYPETEAYIERVMGFYQGYQSRTAD